MDAQGTPVSLGALLDTQAGKNIYVVTSIIRKYPLLAYLGFNIPNHYKQSILDDKLTYEEAGKINFKEIWNIRPTMSEDGSKVTWYEATSFANVQKIAADTASWTEEQITLVDVKWFAVWDVVVTIPASWSAWTRVQAKITAINASTKVVTLNADASVAAWDSLMFLYPSFEFNTKVSRTVADDDATPITTYFQKFGWSLTYNIQEINKVYLFEDAAWKIKNKLSQTTNQAINNFAYTWYMWRNISWANAETDGLVRVIAEKVANGEAVNIQITWASDAAKIAVIQNMLTQACSSPVYMSNEQPTWIVNEKMIWELSKLLQSSVVYNDFVTKDIDWGLKAFSSPFYKWITFIVDQSLNSLYPVTAQGFLIPKHLVSFMTPFYDTPDAAWVHKTYTANWFKLIKQPVTTWDSVEFTLELWIANIFAGQSYPNSYMSFYF